MSTTVKTRSSASGLALLASSVALLLAGCGNDIDELQAKVDEIKSAPGTGVEPLPEVKPYETFNYAAAASALPSPAFRSSSNSTSRARGTPSTLARLPTPRPNGRRGTAEASMLTTWEAAGRGTVQRGFMGLRGKSNGKWPPDRPAASAPRVCGPLPNMG